MGNIETVHQIETDKGIVVKVNKKVLPARDDLPEKTSFSVNLGRKGNDPGRTMPLFLRRGENAQSMVIGLERAIAEALEIAEKKFLEALPPRTPKAGPTHVAHKPSRDAYARVGTHGRKKVKHTEGE